MGKRWCSGLRRVFSCKEKEKNKKEKLKKKKWGFGKPKEKEQGVFGHEGDSKSVLGVLGTPALPLQLPPSSKKISALRGNGNNQNDYSMVIATAAAAEAVAPCAAVEVVLLTTSLRSPDGLSREEIAATKVQNAFRVYLGRRRLHPLRGMIRLKPSTVRNANKCQTMNTLNAAQKFSRVQSQINQIQIKLSKENQSLPRQLQHKPEKELEKLQLGEDWNDSPQSKEQMEAKLQNRHVAALKRERTLAYAYSHQWLEPWMAARSCEGGRSDADGDRPSNRSCILTSGRAPSCCLSRLLPSTPPSIKGKSPRAGTVCSAAEHDTQSQLSFRSERHTRRHTIGGAPGVRDDESVASSPPVLGYLSSSVSSRAKSRFQTPSAAGASKSIAGTPAGTEQECQVCYLEDKF